MTTGSCFAASFGHRFTQHKFRCVPGLFGTLYNPLSIHKLLAMTAAGTTPSADSYLQAQDIHLNFDFHSEMAGYSRGELELRIRMLLETARQELSEATWLTITYGTAWGWQRKDNQQWVANCHKRPAGEFTRQLLPVAQLAADFTSCLTHLRRINPRLQILLTVSPVRHTRETLQGNSVSKAVLRLLCHELYADHSNVHYFPAFEIMVDDLRDYRFYAEDLLHPSPLAEDYLWEKLQAQFMNEHTRSVLARWTEVQKALSHKPFMPQRASHREFLQKTRQALASLAGELPVEDELRAIDQRILELH